MTNIILNNYCYVVQKYNKDGKDITSQYYYQNKYRIISILTCKIFLKYMFSGNVEVEEALYTFFLVSFPRPLSKATINNTL